ncbi:hypothetical protein IPM65_00925 [Candidatus Roizmanbacteria bacterium]|nr:MAG: hypothetical protein IPM65_00925 [Candidatus Roizmanbacteria bacterium]
MRWKLLLLVGALLVVPRVFAQEKTINPQLQELLIQQGRMSCDAGLRGSMVDRQGVSQKLEQADPSVLQYCTNNSSYKCSSTEFKSMVCSNLAIGNLWWQSGDYHDCKDYCEKWGTNGDYLIRLYEQKVTPNEPTSTPVPLPSPTTEPKQISYCTKSDGATVPSCEDTAVFTTVQGCDSVALNEAIDALPPTHNFWNCGIPVDPNADNRTRSDALTDCALLQYEQIFNSWGGGSAFVCHQNWLLTKDADGEYDPSRQVPNHEARDRFVIRFLNKNIEAGSITEIPPEYDFVPEATIDNFEKQLEMTVCGLEEGGACCLGGVAIDMQAPPDFSDPTLAKKNNWFTNLFSEETKQKIIGLFTGGINPAEELTSSMDMCTGTINGEDGQEVPLVPNPYRVTVDDEGNVVGTREAITKKEELDEIWDWIKPAQNAVPSAKTEAWEEAREKFRQGFGDGKSVACYCEVPETSVEGVTSGGEVRGVTVNPDDYPYGTRWNPARGMNVRSAFESNYCAKLTDEEIEKRFGYDSTGMDALNRGDECSKVMADTYFKAHEICKSIKDVKDSDGNYDKEEFAKCFDCMMDKDGVWTAFGCMYSDFSKTLNERVFGLAISFAGMIALGCIIYASFLMQTSAGNPERTGKAQELMTACITGLIVIIFSIFILRVIGVDILRLPGFGGPSPTPIPSSE